MSRPRDPISWRRAAVAAGLLLASVGTLAGRPALAAGTGGGLEVPNLPAERITHPGEHGLCQCITDDRTLHMSCLSGRGECQSACATNVYSYVPEAPFSCPAAAAATGAAASPTIPASASAPMSPTR